MQHHHQDQHEQGQGQPTTFPFNSAPGPADLASLQDTTRVDPRFGSPRARERPPRQSPPASVPRRRRVSSSPIRQQHRRLYSEQTPPPSEHDSLVEQHQYEPEPLPRTQRSVSEQHLDARVDGLERDHWQGNPPRPSSLGRPRSTRERSGARSDLQARGLKKRSQSLGDRMALAIANPREPPPPSSLLLYHVSRPEPRGMSSSESLLGELAGEERERETGEDKALATKSVLTRCLDFIFFVCSCLTSLSL